MSREKKPESTEERLSECSRRTFLKTSALGAGALATPELAAGAPAPQSEASGASTADTCTECWFEPWEWDVRHHRSSTVRCRTPALWRIRVSPAHGSPEEWDDLDWRRSRRTFCERAGRGPSAP